MTHFRPNNPSHQVHRRQDRSVSAYKPCLPPTPAYLQASWVDWQLWTAATLTDATLRSSMITLIAKYASSRLNNLPFPDRYNSVNGQMIEFSDRTVVGGHFALVRRSTPQRVRDAQIDLFSFSFLVLCLVALTAAAVEATAERTGGNQTLDLRFWQLLSRCSLHSPLHFSRVRPSSLTEGLAVRCI